MSMVDKEGFKETVIGWIPYDWKCEQLGHYVTLLTGSPFASDKFSQENGVPLIRIRDLKRSFSETYYTGDFDERYLVQTGDVLVSMDGEFHVVRWQGTKALLNQRVLKISAKTGFSDEGFLFFLVAKAIGKIQDSISATTVKHLSTKDLQNLIAAIPPLPEQRKISSILTTVDEKLNIIVQQIEVIKNFKLSLMQSLFSQGIGIPDADDNWHPHTNFKDSALGRIPEAWLAEKLNFHVSKVGSGVTPKGGSDSYLDTGIPLIRSQNILVGKLSLDDVVFISYEQHKKMSNSALIPNDVLLNITGASIGRCAVLPADFNEGNVNQHVCIIRTEQSLNSHFLCHYLNSNFGQKLIDKFQAGGNREGLNYQQIRSFDIPLPPITEQEEIAKILGSIDEKIEILISKKALYQTLKRGLMEKLLTGEWRVKIDDALTT